MNLLGKFIFSIDKLGTKTIDDAFSIEQTANRNVWSIGIHISNVDFFVKAQSRLDNEAARRVSNSYIVYRPIWPH